MYHMRMEGKGVESLSKADLRNSLFYLLSVLLIFFNHTVMHFCLFATIDSNRQKLSLIIT